MSWPIVIYIYLPNSMHIFIEMDQMKLWVYWPYWSFGRSEVIWFVGIGNSESGQVSIFLEAPSMCCTKGASS